MYTYTHNTHTHTCTHTHTQHTHMYTYTHTIHTHTHTYNEKNDFHANDFLSGHVNKQIKITVLRRQCKSYDVASLPTFSIYLWICLRTS